MRPTILEENTHMDNLISTAKAALIEALSQDQASSYLAAQSEHAQLVQRFKEGFKGFNQMSVAELVQAVHDSGLTSTLADQLAVLEAASSEQEYFPGASVEEVGSITMQEIVGDYDTPDTVPEWAWVEARASFTHCKNGQAGVWEFVLNLAKAFDDIPDKLAPVLAEATKKHLSYLVIHQGT